MQSVVEYDVAIPWVHEMRLLERGRMRKSVENQVFFVRGLLINRHIPPIGVAVVKPGTVVGICCSHISRHSISQLAARELKNIIWSKL